MKLNLKYIEGLNITDIVAKANIGIECPSSEEQNWLRIFSATFAISLFEFDDHFDEPISTPENVAGLSMEMRVILRALSKHSLGGLQETWMIGPLQCLPRKPTSGFLEKVKV